MSRILIKNIGQLYTLEPLHRHSKTVGIQTEDLGLIEKAWLVIENGKVARYGRGTPHDVDVDRLIDAEGKMILPGLVDCHTHPVFGGSRSHEFAMRLNGKTYQDIAKAGGGILSTVDKTREATENELTAIAVTHAKCFLSHGVTTFEAKSGYGLSTEEELKLLRAIAKISEHTGQTVLATCLGLHAVPRNTSKEDYIRACTEELLPRVAADKLAVFADAFVEKGYFEPEDCEAYFAKARELGFLIRIHADEFCDSRAALAAARWQAKSADHLEKASPEGIAAMAKAGVTAVLLPGTSLYCRMEYTDARPFMSAGCPVALATDFNPGSCRVDNLAFIATLGALHCHMDVATTIAAVTYVPATSLGVATHKGHLAQGADADFVITSYPNLEEWIADLGQKSPVSVWLRGVEGAY